jgi:urease accessory protein
VFLNKKLVLKENLLIKPASHTINAMGYMEGYTHQASFIYLDESASVNELNELVTRYLAEEDTIAFGITAAPINGLLVRILGQRAEQLHECHKKIAKILLQHTSQKELVYAK